MSLGIYIHVPFCLSKCPYCDFYSLTGQDDSVMDAYTAAVEDTLRREAEKWEAVADTLYFGGGTPSLLGPARIERLTAAAVRAFAIDGEITMEANPGDALGDTFAAFAAAGGNRVSMGMQAATDAELRFLGRRHATEQTARAVAAARAAGIQNLSLDLMLGLAGQTNETIRAATDKVAALGVNHVSAYLLKIEPETVFARRRETLGLPDDDRAADEYLFTVDALRQRGFRQYEISNFARPGGESRHNLKYWNSEPYLGIGPAAHSFLDGRRSFYPRDLARFIAGGEPLAEGDGNERIREGGPEEYAMLRLRLTEGLTEAGFAARFGKPLPAVWRERAEGLPAQLVVTDARGIRLTPEGFLVSNAVLETILEG